MFNFSLNTIFSNIIILIFSIICIYIAGTVLYIHDNMPNGKKNPIYFALGIAFAGTGGSILTKFLFNTVLPNKINKEIFKYS